MDHTQARIISHNQREILRPTLLLTLTCSPADALGHVELLPRIGS